MYKFCQQPVNHRLQDVLMRGDSFFILRDEYVQRARMIETLDEETKQMKYQTMFLYLMAIGEKQYRETSTEYQAELLMEGQSDREGEG